MTVQQMTAGVPEDTLPLRLSILRFHAGRLSAAEAGRRIDVSGQTWRNWEEGKHRPTARDLTAISVEFACDREWLLRGGPLSAPTSDDGGRARQDSNLRPADYPIPSLDDYRDRRNGRRRRWLRRGVEAA